MLLYEHRCFDRESVYQNKCAYILQVSYCMSVKILLQGHVSIFEPYVVCIFLIYTVILSRPYAKDSMTHALQVPSINLMTTDQRIDLLCLALIIFKDLFTKFKQHFV